MTDSTITTQSLLCLALVRPGSPLAVALAAEKPVWGVYEFDQDTGTREIRWGDGSGRALFAEDMDSLELLPAHGAEKIQSLFDY